MSSGQVIGNRPTKSTCRNSVPCCPFRAGEPRRDERVGQLEPGVRHQGPPRDEDNDAGRGAADVLDSPRVAGHPEQGSSCRLGPRRRAAPSLGRRCPCRPRTCLRSGPSCTPRHAGGGEITTLMYGRSGGSRAEMESRPPSSPGLPSCAPRNQSM